MKKICIRAIALALVFVMSLQLISCTIEQENGESVCETEVQSSVSGPRISISTLEPTSDGHEYTTKTKSYQLDTLIRFMGYFCLEKNDTAISENVLTYLIISYIIIIVRV